MMSIICGMVMRIKKARVKRRVHKPLNVLEVRNDSSIYKHIRNSHNMEFLCQYSVIQPSKYKMQQFCWICEHNIRNAGNLSSQELSVSQRFGHIVRKYEGGPKNNRNLFLLFFVLYFY
jgi:hypothetical protein